MEASKLRDPVFWRSSEGLLLNPRREVPVDDELVRLVRAEGTIAFATSGSGGEIKWVSLRREALLASAEAVNRHLAVESSDLWMLALPLVHVGGFGVVARAYAAGCGVRRLAGRWNAMRFAEELESTRATLTSLVPTQVHDLVTCGLRAPASLRAVVVGGAPLDEVAGQEARDLGWPVLQSYGMTETASQVATAPLAALDAEFRSAPLPVLPGWAHQLGEDGCLRVRGEALCEGYLRRTNGGWRLERPFEDGGWFATSDRAELSAEGLTVLGRADRQVKILGELVDVQEIERDLRAQLPAGIDLHVLLQPDRRRGWRLVPVLAGADDGAEDVVEFLNARLPGFARLEAPRRVAALPRTGLGKVDVVRLRADLGITER